MRRKWLLALGVSGDLALLGYYKYADFVAQNLNALTSWNLPHLEILLPLAISFFTFQQIAYLVDCYRSEVSEYNFFSYCLFVSFFPQLIAGPIVHHRGMMPQFLSDEAKRIRLDNVSMGLFVFGLGLFKKVVIADTLSHWANAGHAAPHSLTLYDAWITSLSYTFQLYYDFCGYSDMAIGAGLLFNIRLPVNFHVPYRASDIQDFWRRWHMTLSAWLRDYVYIPFGGNRHGTARTYVNIMATFLLGGLWHGAGWPFVLWGGMHGVAISLHRLWKRLGLRMPSLVGWLVTFLFVNATWVFFRAEDLESATAILRSMVGLGTTPGSSVFPALWSHLRSVELLVVDPQQWLSIPLDANGWILLSLLAIGVVPASVEMIGFLPSQTRWRFRPGLATGLLSAGLFGVALIYALMSRGTEFLYFNF